MEKGLKPRYNLALGDCGSPNHFALSPSNHTLKLGDHNHSSLAQLGQKLSAQNQVSWHEVSQGSLLKVASSIQKLP